MTESFIDLINQHGYLALFCFVFLQEIGAPNPIPNEFVLIGSGYLIHNGYFSFLGVFTTIVLGDISASLLLYTLFYFFGYWAVNSKPRWIPIPTQTILKLSRKINKGGLLFVFLGRLAPFIRGYVAVISGLTRLNFKKYTMIICTTTSIWGLFYLTIGYFISPYWQITQPYFSKSIYILGAVFLSFAVIILFKKTSFRLFLKS